MASSGASVRHTENPFFPAGFGFTANGKAVRCQEKSEQSLDECEPRATLKTVPEYPYKVLYGS